MVGAVTKPHIIHILADDLGWSEVGAIVEFAVDWDCEHEIFVLFDPRQFKGSTVKTDLGPCSSS